jgi:hypothetical protein
MTWIACMTVLAGCRFGFDELGGSGNVDDDDDDDDGVIVTPPIPGTARVTVIGEDGEPNVGQPIKDAYVVAIEADGTTTTVRTDPSGEANIAVSGNTALHVARLLDSGEWALSSFRAVNDGAQLVVGGRPPLGTSMAKSVTVNLPPFPMDYDQAWITGPRGCLVDAAWAMSTTIPVTFDPRCEGKTVELYALAFDIYVPIGSITLTDGDTIDRTAAAWTDLDKVGMDYVNVPADVTDTYAFVSWPTATGDLIPMSESADVPDMGFVGLGFDVPPIVPGTTMVHVFESPAGARALFERIDSWPGTRELDAANLPAVPTPAIDTTSSQVQWTAGGAPLDADLYWSNTKITTGTTNLYWDAYGPPGATQVTFPVLPTELAHLVPDTTSTWYTPRIVIVGLSDFDYASALGFVDRDIYWWWSEGVHMPAGTVSMTATALPW